MIFSELMNFFLRYFTAMLVLVGLLFAWLIFRHVKRRFPTTKIATPIRGARIARRAEALLLTLFAGITFIAHASRAGVGLRESILGQFSPLYARINFIAFTAIALAILIAGLFTWAGRMLTGFVILAASVILLALWTSGGYPGAGFIPASVARINATYTIAVESEGFRGVEVWINGVHVGSAPLRMPLDTMVAQIPDWPSPPPDFNTEVKYAQQYHSTGTWRVSKRIWTLIKIPDPQCLTYDSLRSNSFEKNPQKEFYVQLRYAGEIGLVDPGSVNNSHMSSGAEAQSFCTLIAIFPQHDDRLRTLLNQARLADYHPDDAWFQAIETYQDGGWRAIRKAADTEPAIMQLLDGWARWKYKLAGVRTSQDAWQAFQLIRDQAHASGEYSTAGVAGRAVELLADQLDSDRLAGLAVSLMPQTQSFAYSYGTSNGDLQFGASAEGGGVDVGQGMQFNGYFSSSDSLPISAYPVAHALWIQWKHRIGRAIIQQQVVPAVIAWHYDTNSLIAMTIISTFGGSAADDFLQRQNWSASDSNTFNLGHFGANINRWFYALATLQDPAGDKFREEHLDEIITLAEKFFPDFALNWRPDMDWIMVDPRVAKRFWPRFAQLAREKSRDQSLSLQWAYLRRMGRDADAEMYLDAFRQTRTTQSDLDNAEYSELIKLPNPLRTAVIESLIEELNSNGRHYRQLFTESDSRDDVNNIQRFIAQLQSYITPVDQAARQAQSDFDQLQNLAPGLPDDRRQQLILWLSHDGGSSPVVGLFASSERSELRALAPFGIDAVPTPANRQLLTKLLLDADPAVSEHAQAAQSRLKILGNIDPATLTSSLNLKSAESRR